ncbi:hypothetical protein [Streptomyces sp. UG1]|uniref:hypothetical protein n=1 Tax=Streptomyces sp. UG1 TaxID=3417652 RepID=UPI003CE7575E
MNSASRTVSRFSPGPSCAAHRAGASARKNSAAAARRVHELIEEGVQAGVFRALNGHFAAQVVAVTIDAVQSGVLLERTGLTAGDAFSELGDLLLDGLSSERGAFEPPSAAVRWPRNQV